MSKPEAGPAGRALPVRVQLIADLGACLTQWHRATAQGPRPVHPNMAWLRGLSIELVTRTRNAGFAAVALQLSELLRRLDAGGAAGDVREPLRALFGLAEQARQSLTPEEQSLLARAFGSSPPASAPGAPSGPPALSGGYAISPVQKSVMPQTPLGAATLRISEDATPLRPAGASPSGRPPAQESAVAAVPAQGTVLLQKPVRPSAPAQGTALFQQAVVPPAPVSPAVPAREPIRAPAPPPPAVWQPAAQPPAAQRGSPGGGSVPAASSGRPPAAWQPAAQPPSAQPQSAVAVSRSSPGGSTPAPSSGGPPPVATPASNSAMPAVSSARPASPATPAPQSPPIIASARPAEPAEGPSSIFGLRAFRRRPASLPSAAVRQDSAPLFGIARRAASAAPLTGESAGRARRMQDLLGNVGRSRPGSQGKARALSAVSAKAQYKLVAWRMGAIAAAALVLVGLATAIIVFKRRADESERARLASAAAAAAKQAAKADAGAPAELPRTRLLDADETYRALLTQVHGRGKESPELRALVDEQAALAARKCEGSSAACRQWAEIRKALTGDANKRITRRRAAGSPDRIDSGWMLGLKLPEIHVEDDPRVRRQFEYYTVGTVGRELFQAMLFRCGAYRDLIESTLIRYGLPIDVIAVVFTESGCEPQAVSPVGAAGLWQFMPETARAYHLRVKEGVIDERRSPPKSTEAAVRFLRDLHDKLVVYNKDGVWDLVFGAFNLGPFAMAARAERAGSGVSFWDLVDAEMLPDETAQYTPTVQAVALILNNLQKLKFAGVQMRSPQLTSDLEVPAGTRLSLIARAASTSVNQLRSMNLDISSDRTPALPNFAVQVPKDVVFQAGDTLKALIAAKDDSDLCVSPSFDWGRELFNEEMAKACQRKLGRKPVTN